MDFLRSPVALRAPKTPRHRRPPEVLIKPGLTEVAPADADIRTRALAL
jgi:hypothetical protein